MSISLRTAFLWLAVLLLYGCEKDKDYGSEDNFIDQPEQLSELKAEVSAAGTQFIELQWPVVKNTHFKDVSYALYLDGLKVIEGINATKYSLINLKAGQKYTIKISASSEGKQIEQIINTSTLTPSTGNPTIYQEYNLHSYSRITGPTALKQLADGGHIAVRLLQHPGTFADENFKVVVFKVDQSGNMLWYRLLSVKAYSFSTYGEFFVTSHKEDQEGLLFIQNSVVKFSVKTGEVLLEKSYADRLPEQSFESVFKTSAQEVIAGTSTGSLLSINPDDLSLNWHQPNTNQLGSIVAINVDSKKNIYYIFRNTNERNTSIRVHKCDSKGQFLNNFLFDGTLNNESNLGFWMTSLLVDEQDNLYLFGRNSDFNFLRYFKFSTDGTVLKKNEKSDYLSAEKAFFNNKGEIVVVGQVDGGGLNTYAGLYIFDKEMNIKSKRYYTEIPSHIIRGISGNPDGSYNIFLNFRQTYTYENPNFVFIKTDADGNI